MAPVPSQCVEDLDAFSACGLVALLHSRENRRPVTPTKRLTTQVLEVLQARGIIALPWPAPRWELPPRGYLTPLEQLGWDYAWTPMVLGGLADVIEETFARRSFDEAHVSDLVTTWRTLVHSQCAEYFEFQLAKHGMNPEWSTDLDWLPRGYWDDLSLARWKYLIWAAVRHGAMQCLGTGMDAARTREAIAGMLASPQRLGYTVREEFEGFLPKHPHAHSLMAGSFLRLSGLGMSYWTQPPSLVGWERHYVFQKT